MDKTMAENTKLAAEIEKKIKKAEIDGNDEIIKQEKEKLGLLDKEQKKLKDISLYIWHPKNSDIIRNREKNS
jgi:hypothetical protein